MRNIKTVSKSMLRLVSLTILFTCIFLLPACLDELPVFEEVKPGPGSISGKVTNSVTGLPISGATVSTLPATSVVTTDSTGKYILANIPAGSYTITVELTGYETKSVDVTISSNGAAIGNLTLIQYIGSISGTVTNSINGLSLSGATVSTLPATSIVTTNAEGKYMYENIPAGSYTVTAALTDYETKSVNFIVSSNEVTVGSLTLVLLDLSGLGIDFIYIQGSTFQMGDTFNEGSNNERPVHTVQLSSYRLSKTEITFAQYDMFCDSTGRSKPSDNGWGRGTRPVINVSWNDALAFCTWASTQLGKTVRLPTEAEWEFAARGGGQNIRYSGTSETTQLINYAWYSANSESKTNPVAKKLPNSLGLYDMSGNVWEWCSDWYSSTYYSTSPVNNPQGPVSGTYRILRGGSWGSTDQGCRAASRNSASAYDRFYIVGFRVASAE